MRRLLVLAGTAALAVGVTACGATPADDPAGGSSPAGQPAVGSPADELGQVRSTLDAIDSELAGDDSP